MKIIMVSFYTSQPFKPQKGAKSAISGGGAILPKFGQGRGVKPNPIFPDQAEMTLKTEKLAIKVKIY